MVARSWTHEHSVNAAFSAIPRLPDAKDTLNRRVKMREAFRPFAPAVLLEEGSNWFDFDGTAPESPFMLRVVPGEARKEKRRARVVHVDGTGRLQTLTRENNGLILRVG